MVAAVARERIALLSFVVFGCVVFAMAAVCVVCTFCCLHTVSSTSRVLCVVMFKEKQAYVREEDPATQIILDEPAAAQKR